MTAPPVIIAIPARNEAERIGACLAAIASQPGAQACIAGLVVYANNCTDETAAVAGAAVVPFPLHVIAADLPSTSAHIGHARRGATDAALNCAMAAAHSDAIIAGTDADSRVAPGWLAALVAAFAAGVDAVCGTIDLDGPVAPELAAVRAAEAAYAETTARVVAYLDPLPHDPWPNHIWSWGANFALRATTLVAVGGSPIVDLAEDRALHAELLRRDVRIRHSDTVRVTTSARPDGRAPGGFADLMTAYANDPQALADYNLEPAAMTWQRAAQRGAARRRWGDRPGFGAAWADREANTPALRRGRIALAALEFETARLSALLERATDQSCSRALDVAS